MHPDACRRCSVTNKAEVVQTTLSLLPHAGDQLDVQGVVTDKDSLRSFRALLNNYAKKAGMTLKTKRVGDDLRIWRVE